MADLNLAIIVRAVDRATGPLKRLTAQTDRLREANRRLGRVARFAGVGFGALAFGVKKFVDTAADFEDMRATLETLEGSSEKARRSMRWVEQFAATTPFDLREVSEAFVRLRSYGLEPTGGLMRTLGDTAAAMGKPIMQAVEAIADAVTGENERLKEFGIKARVIKGGMIRYEYSVDGETKFAQALADDRAQIQEVLRGILDPRYGGAMERRSKTLRGIMSNLMDQWTRFQNLVMEAGAFKWLRDRLQGVLDIINKMAEDGSLEALAETIGQRLTRAFKAIDQAIRQVWPWVVRIGKALAWAAEQMGGWGNLALTLTGLYIAGPFISLTAALKGVTAWSGKALAGIRSVNAAAAVPTGTAAMGVASTFGSAGITGLGGQLPGAAAKAAPAAGIAAKATGFARFSGVLKVLAGLLGIVSIKFIAIGAVVAMVAGLVYKYWEPIKAFFAGVWAGFTEALQPVYEALKPFFAAFGEWLQPLITWFKELFVPVEMCVEALGGFEAAGKAVGKAIGGLIINIIDFIDGLIKLPLLIGEAGVRLIGALVGGIESEEKKPAAAVTKALDRVSEQLPSSDAKKGPLSRLTAAGASILETMGLGVLRAGPGALQRPLARALGTAAAGLALSLPVPGAAGAAAPQAVGAAAPQAVGAAAPQVRGGGLGAGGAVDQGIHIGQLIINQQPGEDAGALADKVLREINQRRRLSEYEADYDEL